MKVLFRELFSEFEDDMINIPGNTVCSEINISKEVVMNKALVKTGLKKNRKPLGKIIKLSMIAAVVAVVFAISSTIIYANGGFRIVAEEFFGGSMNPAGLYDGGNVEIKTDDPDLDISFSGVTGDENEVYAVIKAEKRNGGTFTDDGYENPYTFSGVQAVCKDRYGNNFGYGDNGIASIETKYYLSKDRKTIKLLIHLDTDTSSGSKHLDLRDGTATIRSVSFMAQKNIRTIMTDDRIDEKVHEKFLAKCKEMKIDEKECARLYTPEKIIFCQVERKEYDLPFELTFRMNYRYNGNIKKKLQISDAPNYIKPATRNVQMTVSPFSVRISGESENVNDMTCFEELDTHNSGVVMKDGSKYYFDIRGGSGGGGIGMGKVEEKCQLIYQEKADLTYEVEKILIDTREIKQIILNGDVVYSAE